MVSLRVALDATSLVDVTTGVGRFTGALAERLAQRHDLEVAAFAVSWRGRGRLAAALPPGMRVAGRRVPARLVRTVWLRRDWPTAEWLAGGCDVVHGPNFVVPPARHAAEVLTVHDLTAVRFPELCTADTRQYPSLMARAMSRGAWVHAVSRFVADEVRENFPVDPDRVVTVPNGFTAPGPEVPGTDASTGRRLAGSARYVLTLGTVEPRKDLPSLVRAFDAIAAGDPQLRLVLAGPDGWGVEALTAARDRAVHRRRIRRLGWVSEDQRTALLRGASAFVYPSLYEGFGLPPLEAMAVGTPVVATNAGALPEVLGDAARLVPPGDVDALAGALSQLLTDEAARSALIARGREQAARYDWDTTANGIVELYRTAFAAR